MGWRRLNNAECTGWRVNIFSDFDDDAIRRVLMELNGGC